MALREFATPPPPPHSTPETPLAQSTHIAALRGALPVGSAGTLAAVRSQALLASSSAEPEQPFLSFTNEMLGAFVRTKPPRPVLASTGNDQTGAGGVTDRMMLLLVSLTATTPVAGFTARRVG